MFGHRYHDSLYITVRVKASLKPKIHNKGLLQQNLD
jgi:hypothetical protein